MEKPDATKLIIQEVASKLFQHYGFEKTSMDDIAKMSRKAKGSLYYHFPSKESLFQTVVENEINELKQLLQSILTNTSKRPSQRFSEYLIKRMNFISKTTIYSQALKAEVSEYISLTSVGNLFNFRNNLEEWEKQALTNLFNEWKSIGTINPTFEVPLFIDMLLMVLKSLELPFFMNDKYSEYSHIYNSTARAVAKSLMEPTKKTKRK